jgi:hypothetical protein
MMDKIWLVSHHMSLNRRKVVLEVREKTEATVNT